MTVQLRRGDESGASAVEFAFVFPILLMLIFGMIYFGFAFNTKLTITQAAREGARFGATLPLDQATGDLPADWADQVIARTELAAYGDAGLGAEPRNICVRYLDPDGNVDGWFVNTGGDAAACATELARMVDNDFTLDGPAVHVLVNRTVPLEFILYGRSDLSLWSSGAARYEDSVDVDPGGP